jgi:PAS domain-containing protein
MISPAFPGIADGELTDVLVVQPDGRSPLLMARRRQGCGGDPRVLLDSLDEGVLLICYNTDRIVDANATAARLIGYPLVKLLTMRTDELIPADPSAEIGFLWSRFRQEEASSDRLVFQAEDGSLRSVFYHSWAHVVSGYRLSLLYQP